MRSLRHAVARLTLLVLTATALALALALLLAPLAAAASPKRLASPVTDDAGALPAGAATRIQSAFDRVQSSTGVQPWVWYVDTTSGADPAAFATDTARASGLGGADVLLVIAMQDRAYGYWKGDAVKVSDSDLELLLSRTCPPTSVPARRTRRRSTSPTGSGQSSRRRPRRPRRHRRPMRES